MSEELAKYETTDIQLTTAPAHVLEQATEAAKALKKVIDGKERPVVFNGQTYLEFEDWQTLGRFYGVTCKVTKTDFCEYGGVNGFTATAAAIRSDGMEISAAEASCMRDEPNWQEKPLFQLRSMAQTRACAKALRNVLAWVVVLAGYKPTPAEEMDGVFSPPTKPDPKPNGSPQPEPTHAPVSDDNRTAWTTPFEKDDTPKGTSLSALSNEQVIWWGNYVKKSLDDPKKSKYRATNERSLKVLRAEMKARMEDEPQAFHQDDAEQL